MPILPARTCGRPKSSRRRLMFAVRAALSAMLVVFAACGGSVSTIDSSSSSSGSSGSTSSSGSSSASSSGTGGSSGIGSSGGAVDGSTLFDGGFVKDGGGLKDAQPNDPTCPKTYGEVPGHCTLGVTCGYPQGTCECVGYCGGAPPPPDEDFSHWSCTAKRTDGCPDDAPKTGDLCKTPAKICAYGSCCIEQFVCGQSGTWTSGGVNCPG